MPLKTAAILLGILLLPQTASAEAGYGIPIGFVFFVLFVVVMPVALLIIFVYRSIRLGKHQGHAEYKRKETDRVPIGRLGE